MVLMLCVSSVDAEAQKYFTRNGMISFFSSTPVEDIKAINSSVSCVLDSESGALEFAALMKAFKFKKALMEEHFNENYVESATYPKGTFKGQITNLDEIDFSKDGTYPAKVKGEMNIHGISKEVESEGSIEVKDGNVSILSEFLLSPEDYDIEIPGVVRDKIAEELEINVSAELAPFNR